MEGPPRKISEFPMYFGGRVPSSTLFISNQARLIVKDFIKTVAQSWPTFRKEDLTFYWHTKDGTPPALSGSFCITCQPCHFGSVRWWFNCPQCSARVYYLYWAKDRFGCRKCQSLRYVSKNWTDPFKLANHYGKLRLQTACRPGPKAKRCWRYLVREEQAIERLMAQMKQFCERTRTS